MPRVAFTLLAMLALAPAAVAARAASTPAAYRAQATAVCVRAHREVDGLPTNGGVGTRKQMIQYLTAAIPIERRYVAALRRLQPPAALRAMHEGVVSDEAAQLALTIRFVATLGATPDAGFRAAVKAWGAAGARIDTDENALLRGLHLPKCI